MLSDKSFDYSRSDSERERSVSSKRDYCLRSSRQNIYDSNLAQEKPRFGTELSDRTVTENSSSTKLTCSLLSSECDVWWERNKIPIRPSSKYHTTLDDGLSILEIYDINDMDAGKYSCIARNKYGESITTCRLKVFSGYTPTTNTPPTFTRQMKGTRTVS